MSEKKKLKETKVGGWLLQNAPTVLDVVDDFVPSVSILTNLVKKAVPNLSPEQEAEFTRLAQESYEKELSYSLENTAGARGIYQYSRQMADRLANRVMTWNLPTMLALVLINIVCIRYLESGLLAVVSNVIGILLNQLASERNTVMNFFFGSSTGSKDKDRHTTA